MAPGHAGGGDSKQAVRARTEFLNQGYYAPAAEALATALKDYGVPHNGLVIDAGCGEGYYSTFLGQQGYSVAGVDLSKFAVDAAAKRSARQGIMDSFFGVASVYSLPFSNESASAVVNSFAPCVEEEYLRVLKQGGILAVMYAGPRHLMGLKQALYTQTKENDGRDDLPKGMHLLEERRVQFEISVQGQASIQNLFAMTPYYWKTSPADSEKLTKVQELTTTVDMMIALYQKV